MEAIKHVIYASIQIDNAYSYRDLQRTLTDLKKELAAEYKQIKSIKGKEVVELENVYSALVHIQKIRVNE